MSANATIFVLKMEILGADAVVTYARTTFAEVKALLMKEILEVRERADPNSISSRTSKVIEWSIDRVTDTDVVAMP